jgi:hypothetical protein
MSRRSNYPFAGPLSVEARQRVIDAVQRDMHIEAIRLIRNDTGCGLGEAKATEMHIMKRAGECHWCRGPLSEGEIVDCPRCRSLNISLWG